MRCGAAPAIAAEEAYEPFANVPFRNTVQRRFEIPTLVRLLELPRDATMLEVGCGRGVAFEPLARCCRPASLAGVDVEGDLVAIARANAQTADLAVNVLQADVRALPFADDAFDVVIDFGTCFHIARADDALREISRVMRDGGLFVHETSLAQLTSHPGRFRGHALPWAAVPELVAARSAGFWATRRKRRRA